MELERMYRYASFVVTSLADGKQRPIYKDLYTTGGYDEGYFFPTWMAA
jgi:hypothetical protein